MPMIKPRRSRRVPPLKDADYDHEIILVDNAGDDEEEATDRVPDNLADNVASHSTSPAPESSTANARLGFGDAASDDDASGRPSTQSVQPGLSAALSPVATTNSTTPLLNALSTEPTVASGGATTTERRSQSRGRPTSRYGSISKIVSMPAEGAPSVQVEGATPEGGIPFGDNGKGKQQLQQQPPQLVDAPVSVQPGRPSMQCSVRSEAGSAIDILYENQRGGFLCGIPVFSRQALGNLDPSPWTNAAQKTSPTDINTAQVPDPSWEWVWPEWHVNHDEGVDEDGWEYSFMFSKYFSWHGPTWYSSCVRRRAWTRKRVKRKSDIARSAAASAVGLGDIDSVTDPHLLNPEYFTVVSAASARRSASRASSRPGSRISLAVPSIAGSSRRRLSSDASSGSGGDDSDGSRYLEMPKEIRDADVLMCFLRAARIDREKIVAVDNFIENAGEDLVRLQDFMHEIMALFVFQASRRTLLTHLTKAHDAAVRVRQKATDEAEAEAGTKVGADMSEREAAEKPATTDAKPAGGESTQEAEDSNGKAAAVSGDDDVAAEDGPPAAPLTDQEMDTRHKLQALGRRVGYLTAAVKHADEEVRRLEYWSDIKAMAQRGTAVGAVSEGAGWDAAK